MKNPHTSPGGHPELESLRRQASELEAMVAQLRHIESALSESERQYNELVAGIPDGVYRLDANGRFTFVNEVIAERSGFPAERFMGLHFLEVVTPESRHATQSAFKRTLSSEKVPPFELDYVTADGTILSVETNITPIWRDSKVVGILGISRDVTERRQAARALEEREETERALLNASGETAGLLGPDGTVAAVNEIGAARLGSTPGQLVGRSVDEVLPAEVARDRKTQCRKVLRSGKPVVFEDHRNGMWFENRFHPIFDAEGRVVRVAVFARDITKQKESETALKESQQRNAAMVEALPDLLFVQDRHGNYLDYKAPSQDELYRRPEDFLGRSMMDVLPKELAERTHQSMLRVLRTGKMETFDYELTIQGQSRHYEARIVRCGKDKTLSIVRNISAQKQAESDSRQAHRKLVTAREQERKLLARELHDTIGQKLIAAQLRLQGIRGQRCLPEDASCAGAIDGACEQIQDLIHETRRISYGLYPPALESLGLSSALGELERDWTSKEVEIRRRCPAALREARFDDSVEISLFRIAQEALANAVRHGKARHVELKLGLAKGQLRLAVVNDGEAFDPEQRTGVGLGLNSMRERAEAIGGALRISSQPGRTCVEVLIQALRKN